MRQGRGQADCLCGGIGRAAALLKVLAHRDRLLLLAWLARAEHDVASLGRATGIAQPSLSQHLAVLRRAGLVATRRFGKHIHYRTTSSEALAFVALMEQGAGLQAPPAGAQGRAVIPGSAPARASARSAASVPSRRRPVP